MFVLLDTMSGKVSVVVRNLVVVGEMFYRVELKDFLCENLGIDADVLEFDTQLFGDGEIGLDSIDSLEIIAYVDDEFGVQMTGVGKEHFYSIETIAKYIEENA